MKILWLLSNVTKDNIILVQLFLSYSWFFIFNRVSDGDIFNAGTLDSFKISVNDCPSCTHPHNGRYKIKENLKSLPSSYIVPKGSPLSASTYIEILLTF